MVGIRPLRSEKEKEKSAQVFVKQGLAKAGQDTSVWYQCCTEEDNTPEMGCGHKFLEPAPTSFITCPKCGNFWVKWIHYNDSEKEIGL